MLLVLCWWHLRLLYLTESLETFQDFFKCPNVNWSFEIESEKQNRMLFPDVHIVHKDRKFTFSIRHRPIFIGIYTLRHIFTISLSIWYLLPIYILICSCLQICPCWTKSHTILLPQKEINASKNHGWHTCS